VLSGYIHITDWYATFCALAGVDAADDVVSNGFQRMQHNTQGEEAAPSAALTEICMNLYNYCK
jgi:hypothetical protein